MNVNNDFPTSRNSTTVPSFDQDTPLEGGRDSGSVTHVQLPSVNLAELLSIRFVPKNDITAYELSILLPFIFRGIATAQEVKDTGEAKRHLIVMPFCP